MKGNLIEEFYKLIILNWTLIGIAATVFIFYDALIIKNETKEKEKIENISNPEIKLK